MRICIYIYTSSSSTTVRIQYSRAKRSPLSLQISAQSALFLLLHCSSVYILSLQLVVQFLFASLVPPLLSSTFLFSFSSCCHCQQEALCPELLSRNLSPECFSPKFLNLIPLSPKPQTLHLPNPKTPKPRNVTPLRGPGTVERRREKVQLDAGGRTGASSRRFWAGTGSIR